MPSPAEVAAFQVLLQKLGTVASTAVATVWANAADSEQVKNAFGPTIDPYVAASGTLTAQWYYNLNPDSAFATEVTAAPATEMFQKSAGWAYSQADPLEALKLITERHIFTASRDTVVQNARREGVKYARYASANACAWCRVLATREAVYHSAENAIKGHDGCHCMAVPVRNGDSWTPPDYTQSWMQEYNDARDAVGGNLDDIVNHMRRTQ